MLAQMANWGEPLQKADRWYQVRMFASGFVVE
jgi:hypothetical protein